MNQVRITSHENSFVTLTSHGGNVPVTIANNLVTPVQRHGAAGSPTSD